MSELTNTTGAAAEERIIIESRHLNLYYGESHGSRT